MTVEIQSFAPAKINLYLHVTGRRPDGYHELDSLVLFIDVGDHLWAEPDHDVSLALEGPFAQGLGSNRDNLVIKAAKAFQSSAVCGGAKFKLRKNLPLASGIGGGSTDAAAAFRLMDRLYPNRMNRNALMRLALTLGADLPVCLSARPTIMQGIGEHLLPAPLLPEMYLVLINPGIALSTADVFRAYSGAYSKAVLWDRSPSNLHDFTLMLRQTRNDLESPARFLAPIIASPLAALEAQPGCLLARMSGSGATCFGLFPNRFQADRAEAVLRRNAPDWWVHAANIWKETGLV